MTGGLRQSQAFGGIMGRTRLYLRASSLAAVTAAVFATSLTVQPFAAAATAPVKVHKAPREKMLPNTLVGLTHTTPQFGSMTGPASTSAWPTSTSAPLTLAAGTLAEVPAGATHMSLGRTHGNSAAQDLSVQLLPQSASQAANVAGPLYAVTGDLSQPLNLALNYTSFAHLGGANWGNRLQLVQLPACALATPRLAKCQVQTPMGSSNPGRGTLTALVHSQVAQAVPAPPPSTGTAAPTPTPTPGAAGSVTPSPTSGRSTASTPNATSSANSAATSAAKPRAKQSSTVVMAVTAGTSGSNGAFTATSLAPSGSWSTGGSTGSFTYSYPILTPPAGTGGDVAPKVSLGYNSGAVDGQIASSNNQSSTVGEGWGYDPGFIERTYRTCSDLTSGGTQDECWAGNIVTVHLPNGPTEALVRDDTTGSWHLQNDNGDRVTYCSAQNTAAPCASPAVSNGAWNSEYWIITTPDGIQYTFGRSVLPGGTTTNATHSAWTTRVYGLNSGDPCHGSTFAASACTNMAWRWNLDMAQDTHHNVAAYYYATETNNYGANNGTAGVQYVRAGYLTHIDYGLNDAAGSIYTNTAPDTVYFTVSERCTPSTGVTCAPANFTSDFTTAHASNWLDTPVDLYCANGASCNTHAPTYWTTQRYASIYTELAGSTRHIDDYTLGTGFTTTGDPEMMLNTIKRAATGADGSSITLPTVSFGYTEMASRVSGYGGFATMDFNRLIGITTETGEDILVNYSGQTGQGPYAQPLCTSATVPGNLSQNTTECYPVYWTQVNHTTPSLDFFHKYVVTTVEQEDATGTVPARFTTYNYTLSSPAWHYDDNEVVKPAYRTWGQFRGYGQVETRTGDVNSNVTGLGHDQLTLSRTTYFRGMDGDYTPSGPRTSTVTDSENVKHTDSDQYAGMPLETTTFNGDGGTQLSTKITTYTTIATTATRTRTTPLPPLTAMIVNQAESTTFTNTASDGVQKSDTATTYDTIGRTATVTSSGTGATTSCVSTSYADNTTTWVRNDPSDVSTYSGACGGTVMRETRTYYDGSTTLGAITNGDATEVDQAKDFAGSTEEFTKTTNTYDSYGRPTGTTAYDPGLASGNRSTTTAYTPAGTGPLTQTVVTNPKNQTTTTVLDPARGYTTKSTDVAGRVTTATYDALGRTTAVWKPGQVQGTNSATITYAYLLSQTTPLAVTTKTLVDPGNGTAAGYVTSINIYDSFGGLRQTQADGVGGGRIVSDTFEDSHGWVVKRNTRWYTSGSPTTSLITTADSGISDRKISVYDGAGRPIQVNDYNGASLTSTSQTVYGGDRTTTIPPTGGITTSTRVDGEGHQVELDQYKTAPAVNGNAINGGTFDEETFSYDALGQNIGRTTGATGTSPATATWSLSYDLLGRATSQVSPDSGSSSVTYYDTGEVATATDAAGRTVAYDYDALGRKIGKYSGSMSGTKLAAWTYDTASHGVGQIASNTSYVGSYSYTETSAGYDSNGNSLGSTLTSTDPALSLESSYPTTQTWTSTHLLATQTLASTWVSSTEGTGAEQLSFWYDNHGDPNGLTGENAYVSNATYSPYGEISQYTFGVNNTSAQLTFNRDPQTRRITDANYSGQAALPQIEDTTYNYDLAGNMTKSVDTQGSSGSATETQCYSYNGLDQLTQAWSATDSCTTDPTVLGNNSNVGGAQPYWTTWGYDDSGNRTSQVQHAVTGGLAADTTTTYTMGDTTHVHALTNASTAGGTTSASNYTYATDGSMKTVTTGIATSTFNYGPDGQLANVLTASGTSTYVRDADGNILTRTDPNGTTTLYLPGQEIQLGSGNSSVQATDYYAIGGLVVGIRVNNGHPLQVVSDLHGTNQLATDPSTWTTTRRYLDPFGNALGATTGGTWPGDHGFIGKSVNATTALTDVGAREYDANTGRFTSVDPILSIDPQASNGYAYADNNPNTNTDPSGLRAITADGYECSGNGGGHTCDGAYAAEAADQEAVVRYWEKADGITNSQISAQQKSNQASLDALYVLTSGPMLTGQRTDPLRATREQAGIDLIEQHVAAQHVEQACGGAAAGAGLVLSLHVCWAWGSDGSHGLSVTPGVGGGIEFGGGVTYGRANGIANVYDLHGGFGVVNLGLGPVSGDAYVGLKPNGDRLYGWDVGGGISKFDLGGSIQYTYTFFPFGTSGSK